MTRKTPSPTEAYWSLFAFWVTALLATSLFATVVLAPTLIQRNQLLLADRQLQSQCRVYGKEIGRLELIEDALKHDPEFTPRMARQQLQHVPPATDSAPAQSQGLLAAAAPCWFDSVLDLFGYDDLVRQSALFTAGIMTIVGLTFFNAPVKRIRETVPPADYLEFDHSPFASKVPEQLSYEEQWQYLSGG